MWVYGDRTRRARADELLAEVEDDLARGDPLAALIGLGQLAQGVADAEFEARGCNGRSPEVDGLMQALLEVAQGLPSPWMGEGLGMRGLHATPPRCSRAVNAVRRDTPVPTLPSSRGKGSEIEVRVPEGYAFYALHPALYAAAARTLPPGDWRVIGLRSIGASLAAVVAATLRAPAPVTVRPSGHPFDRRLRLSSELEAEWAAHAGSFVIVDEGPGLSGSSLGAVADALERLGVARERIAFLPGHGGDLGPQASARHRARWAGALRPVASFEEVILPALARGVEALVGPGAEPLRDISGGGWRSERGAEDAPIYAGQERRKFLHRTDHGVWLVKFAGLGRSGAGKLDRARALYAAGFTPEPAGMVEGFLVEGWMEAARPPAVSEPPPLLADYLRFRAGALHADARSGASVADLLEMIRTNAGEALGPAAAAVVDRLASDTDALEALVRRVHVDGRLHRWEWLVLADGQWLKADALDHSEAHDLIGAQDMGWDVAGAEFEFDLEPAAAERLRAAVGTPRELMAVYRPAYLAFQMGLWTNAADAQAGWPEEAARARVLADRYAAALARVLGVDPPAPRG